MRRRVGYLQTTEGIRSPQLAASFISNLNIAKSQKCLTCLDTARSVLSILSLVNAEQPEEGCSDFGGGPGYYSAGALSFEYWPVLTTNDRL